MDIATLLIALGLFCLFIICSGLLLWLVYRRQKASSRGYTRQKGEKFNSTLMPVWQSSLAPLVLLLLSAISSGMLYPSLPQDVVYRFSASGLPEDEMSKAGAIGLMLGIQLLLFALAAGVGWIISRILHDTVSTPALKIVPAFMGNIVAVPQLVIVFLMANMFIFNIYGQAPMPPWIIVSVALGIGTITLVWFVIVMVKNTRNFAKRG